MQSTHYVDPNLHEARFSEPEELEADYTEVVYGNPDGSPDNPAAGLGVEVRCDAEGYVTGALVDGGDTNTIVVSSTGAGKTRRVLSQYMLSCIYAGHNFVAHDPKGELFEFFHTLLEKRNYHVRVLNLRNPMTGDRLNPLQEAAALYKTGKRGRALEIAREIAQSLYLPIEKKDDRFWTEASISLFLCYFTIAASLYAPEQVTLAVIHRIHIDGQKPNSRKTYLQFYLEEHSEEPCYQLGMASITAPDGTRQSIFSVFENGLIRIVLNDEIADMTTDSTFMIDDLATERKPMALFIVTRDEAPGTYSTVVSAFVNMIYAKLIDLAQSCHDKRLPRTVHFILEEFGNIAGLENINDMMTASRSRNIRMMIVLQSLCQLYLPYSKELAHVLIGNSQNLVFMSSTDMELVKMISDRCGTMKDLYTKEKRELMSPNRLTHLNKESGEAVMLLDRHYPHIARFPDLSKYKMIQPSEVRFPERDKVRVENDLFIRTVTDMVNMKTRPLAEAFSGNERKEYKALSLGEMLTIPAGLWNILEKVIVKTNKRDADYV